MTTSTISLDTFVLCNPKTASFVTVASNFSLRTLSSRTSLSSADELLVSIREGDILVEKARSFRLVVSIVLEGKDLADRHDFIDQVASHLADCPIWSQLGLLATRDRDDVCSLRHLSFTVTHLDRTPYPDMPPSTIVGILQHVTCSFHFHRDLRVLEEPEMIILDPCFGSISDVDPNGWPPG